MILINFKIYQETFGDGAIELGKIVKEVKEKYKVRIVVTASALDAYRIKQETGTEVWLQHIDEYSEGKHTGFISIDQAMAMGINGSLLNHSEHKISKGTVLKIIKSKPKGFNIVLCMASTGQIEKWGAKAKPDYILYEPPELIASTDKSAATEEPKVIKKAVELCGNIPLMVGAGVKSEQDVTISLKMGAKAIGLSSAFVLSQNPKEILEGLARGFGSV